MADLKTTLQTNFGLQSGGKPLVIERDPSLFADLNVHLLMWPVNPTSVVCDVGTILLEGTKEVTVPAGSVQFGGGNSATLPKPPTGSFPELQVLFSFSAENGQPTQISLSYDPDTQQIKASKPCYAAVKYGSYKSIARMMTYQPLVESWAGGTVTTYGIIAGFLAPSTVTTFQIDPANIDDGNIEIELYRIVSYGVTNIEGEFELPKNFPTDGSFASNTPSNALVIDTTTAMKTQRVHEIGLMDLRGRGWVRSYFITNKTPYVGNQSYKPTLEFVKGTIPDKTPTGEPISSSFKYLAENFIRSKGYGKV